MDISKVQTKLKKEKLTGLTRDISKETRNLQKLKTKVKTATGDEKKNLENYIETLEEKTNLILKAMSPDKINSANLASLSKALRTLTDRATIAQGGLVKRSEEKKISVNINLDNLSQEELLKLLSEKSQQYDK